MIWPTIVTIRTQIREFRFLVFRNPFTIGLAPDVTILVNDPSLSEERIRIFWGRFLIKDGVDENGDNWRISDSRRSFTVGNLSISLRSPGRKAVGFLITAAISGLAGLWIGF